MEGNPSFLSPPLLKNPYPKCFSLKGPIPPFILNIENNKLFLFKKKLSSSGPHLPTLFGKPCSNKSFGIFSFWLIGQSQTWSIQCHIISNEAKGQISKQVFQEKKAGQIFQKRNISYPLIHTQTFLPSPLFWQTFLTHPPNISIFGKDDSPLWGERYSGNNRTITRIICLA